MEHGIVMGPLGDVPYDPLRHYTAMKTDNDIGLMVITNGIQTEAVFETYKLLYHVATSPAKGYLKKLMDGARFEPDSLETPRIAGVILPRQKKVKIALTYIFGIGKSLALKILAKAKVDPEKRTDLLSVEEVNSLREIIEKEYKVEGDLRGELLSNVKRLKEITSYRGARHTKNLPTRGQRTKTNSRTVRGNVRKTVGSGKKPPAQKT